MLLLAEDFCEFGFQHILFRVFAVLIGELYGDHTVGDLFELTGCEDMVCGGADDQAFQKISADVFFFAFVFGALAACIVKVFASIPGAGGAVHGLATQLAIQFAGKHILCATGAGCTSSAVEFYFFLHLIPKCAVDDRRESVFNIYAMCFADVGAEVPLVRHDAHNAVFVERSTGRSAQPFGIQIGDNGGGRLSGGVLLKDIAHGGCFIFFDDIFMVLICRQSEHTVAAERVAFEGTLADAAAQLLGEFGTVIFGKAFH